MLENSSRVLTNNQLIYYLHKPFTSFRSFMNSRPHFTLGRVLYCLQSLAASAFDIYLPCRLCREPKKFPYCELISTLNLNTKSVTTVQDLCGQQGSKNVKSGCDNKKGYIINPYTKRINTDKLWRMSRKFHPLYTTTLAQTVKILQIYLKPKHFVNQVIRLCSSRTE